MPSSSSSPASPLLQFPTYADIAAAAERLKGHAHHTPVMQSRTLNQRLGAQVFFKCENLQRMGAFKFRGGYNALALFDAAQRRAGVVTFSSGNHAQAVALSAQLLGIPAVVLMPQDAPAAKVAATRGYGAEVIQYDRFTQDREALTRDIARTRGMTLIPPYDHADVLTGQGTAVKELFDEVQAGGRDLDMLFVPVGGGGLLSGACLVAKARAPHCAVYGVEPATGNDAQQSLRSGQLVRIDTPHTIADGAQTQSLGALTFAVIRQSAAEIATDIVTATDAQLIEALRFCAERMKMIVEPTGVLGLAAVCHAGLPVQGKRIGIVLSGGNVDLAKFAQWMA